MKLTPEQETQIRLLSDTDLYAQAQDFARTHPPVEPSQIAGLLEFSRSWQELEQFVKHQKDDRDWGTGSKAHYRDFYAALDAYLDKLRQDVQGRYGFVSDDLTKKQTRRRTARFAGLLAREFIQHLAAEVLWKKEVEGR